MIYQVILNNYQLLLLPNQLYGMTSKKTINHVFDELVLESVKNNETLIITLFAFGRMQEVKYKLLELQKKNLLNKDIKIYCDGKLSFKYDDIFLSHIDKLKISNFLPKNIFKINGYEERLNLLSDQKLQNNLKLHQEWENYGPAQVYLPYYISRPKCTIIFGGYTAENTLGRKLQEVKDNELFELNGVMTKKRAKSIFYK